MRERVLVQASELDLSDGHLFVLLLGSMRQVPRRARVNAAGWLEYSFILMLARLLEPSLLHFLRQIGASCLQHHLLLVERGRQSLVLAANA